MAEKAKLKIIIITPHFPPDGGPSAQLFFLLSKQFLKNGHDVRIICAVPHYPSGKVPQNYKSFSVRKEIYKGINVIRVPLFSVDRRNLYLRLFQFIIMQIGMTIVSINQNADIIITSNPALQTGMPFLIMSKMKSAKKIFSIHDFYPDIGIHLGIFKNKRIIKLVEFIELKCFEKADAIRVLSESFIPLVNRYQKFNNKVFLIYDWVDADFLRPLPKNNEFSRRNKLVDSFNVLYAGNLGYSQGLDIVLKAAKLIEKERDIRFIIVGDGPEKQKLVQIRKDMNLENVLFFPFQPRDFLPSVIATGDLLLVCLKKGMSFTSLPSKIYTILACGRPIIGCLDEGSDSWNLIMKAKAGICIEPENPIKLAESILELKDNRNLLYDFGMKGRNYCETYHSVAAAAERFEELFLNLLRGKTG